MDGDGCIGILVTHDDGRVECLEVDCEDTDAARHEWRSPCAGPGEPCPPCAEAEPRPHRRSLAA